MELRWETDWSFLRNLTHRPELHLHEALDESEWQAIEAAASFLESIDSGFCLGNTDHIVAHWARFPSPWSLRNLLTLVDDIRANLSDLPMFRAKLEDPLQFQQTMQELEVASHFRALGFKTQFVGVNPRSKTPDLQVSYDAHTWIDCEVTTLGSSRRERRASEMVSQIGRAGFDAGLLAARMDILPSDVRFAALLERIGQAITMSNQKGQVVQVLEEPFFRMVVAPRDKWDDFAEARKSMGLDEHASITGPRLTPDTNDRLLYRLLTKVKQLRTPGIVWVHLLDWWAPDHDLPADLAVQLREAVQDQDMLALVVSWERAEYVGEENPTTPPSGRKRYHSVRPLVVFPHEFRHAEAAKPTAALQQFLEGR